MQIYADRATSLANQVLALGAPRGQCAALVIDPDLLIVIVHASPPGGSANTQLPVIIDWLHGYDCAWTAEIDSPRFKQKIAIHR